MVEDLKAAGCFRSLVPRGHGGDEHDLATHMRVLEELARTDGSVGWTVMIGASAPLVLGLLPAQTFEEMYAAGPDVVVGGTFNPTGSAVPTDGGYLASGRWTFASGCQHSDWFLAHCIVDDGRMPPIRMMVVPAADVDIVDTWRVSGLRGTGSHDFTMTEVFVPDAHTFQLGDHSDDRCTGDARAGVVADDVAVRGRRDRDRAGRARRHRSDRHGEVPRLCDGDVGDERAVPQPFRRCRCRAPCGAGPCVRRGDHGLAHCHRPRRVHARAAGAGSGPPPRGRYTPRRRWWTSPTPMGEGPRSARTIHCSAGYAMSTPSPSTSRSSPTRSRWPVPCSSSRTSTPRSCDVAGYVGQQVPSPLTVPVTSVTMLLTSWSASAFLTYHSHRAPSGPWTHVSVFSA